MFQIVINIAISSFGMGLCYYDRLFIVIWAWKGLK